MIIRLLVFGGRRYPLQGHVHEHILQMIDGVPMEQVAIIHGDANREKKIGADYWAHTFCELWRGWGLTEIRCPAAWDNTLVRNAVIRYRAGKPYNILAGFERNQRMLDDWKPTHALGTPGGNGTADMKERIELANKNGAGVQLRMIE
jgi:hypothetical protein